MTATSLGRSRPRLRLVSVRDAEPPYDDEPASPADLVRGNLALAFPPSTAHTTPLRLVPPATPPARGGTGDPRLWTARLAQAMVEVLAGIRPAAQLAAYTTLHVLEQLERSAGRFTRRGASPARRPTVTSVHVGRPLAAVAEACVVVDTGGRRRVLALRLDEVGGRWRCTALEVG
jgi:hypothetical protein